ncbi:MAG: tetratricopeptide repeat protein [Synechococcales cyanobacterium M58_A2018_015]|nr:tetratricopeptide repeat protein [Synechococcales cyanobacterium M58_A2018_015]
MALASLLPLTQHLPSQLNLKRLTAALTGGLVVTLGVLVNPVLADPFRPTNPRQVGDQTEAAFKAMFEQGNYQQAAALLRTAEDDEPLAFALKAALAYIDQNWDVMGENARKTRETAEQLVQTDPLRGHLYIAAGHFLEGAHTLSTQGTVRATPAILSKLQQVFDNLGRAESIDPQDPELNLMKGYMDLMLAVNLPFANPEQAIQRLQNYAQPSYLAQRGIAIAYRDLDQPDRALAAVESALQQTPNNPELFYLKAQILRRQGKEQESLRFFRQALASQDQLPANLVYQIAWEQCRTVNQVRDRERDCSEVAQRQLEQPASEQPQ